MCFFLPIELGVESSHILADGAWLIVVKIIPRLRPTKQNRKNIISHEGCIGYPAG
jgi:hypothetical protein